MEPLIHALLALAPGDFTFALIKPDGIPFKDDIFRMIWAAGYKVMPSSEMPLTPTDIRALYYSHINKPYYDRNASHNMSGPVIPMIIEGPNAVDWWRNEAMPEIRAKWGANDPNNRPANVVHGSDSPEAAFREAHWFYR